MSLLFFINTYAYCVCSRSKLLQYSWGVCLESRARAGWMQTLILQAFFSLHSFPDDAMPS